MRFRLAADVILATFFVSHLTPFGSATGTLVNVSTLETEGIAAATTGEAIGLTSLMSTIALIVLFGTGFAATAGRHVSHQYLVIAGIALFLVVAVLAAVLTVGAHPAVAGQAGRWAASVARHVRPGIDPEKVAETSRRLASLARSALTGRAFLALGSPRVTCSLTCSRSIWCSSPSGTSPASGRWPSPTGRRTSPAPSR